MPRRLGDYRERLQAEGEGKKKTVFGKESRSKGRRG